MNKKIFLSLSLILMCFGALGQSKDFAQANSDFVNNTYNSFIEFYKNGINEKVYVQTDKPYYSAGEKIWFKAHVVNSITHTPLQNGNFIYVQLTDKRDSLFTRVKIKVDEYGFHNNIDLPNTIPEGEYTLTAYTKWMLNWEKEFLFNKKINIANPIDDAYTINASYKPSATKEGELEIQAQFTTSTGISAEGISVICEYERKGKIRKMKTKIGANGVLKFNIPDNLEKSAVTITSDQQDKKFVKTIYTPTVNDKMDVQFFPEGGHLLAGQLQSVVFKAVGVDGKGRNVEGEIFDAQNELVSEFSTEFNGMGRFNFLAAKGESYYAMVYDLDDSTQTVKVNLPTAIDTGCSIKAVLDRNNLIYQILVTENIDTNKIGVVLHSRGKIVNSSLLGSSSKMKRVPLRTLQEGILTITIVDVTDNAFTPIAERLVFIPPKTTNTTLTPDKPAYSTRAKVNIDLEVLDADSKPLEGSYGVSVTDRNTVDPTLIRDNILSNLLLTSDLQGYVEEPAKYFTDNLNADMTNRDLLMLTQGWKRFALTDVLKNQLVKPEILPEEDHVISGVIRGFFGNEARKPSLMVFIPETKFLDLFPLENSAKFNLSGFDYPDSTEIVLQGVNKKGSGSTLNMKINDELFAEPKYVYPNTLINRQEVFIPETYLYQSKERYYYEGGMRVIDVEAITVTADAAPDNNSVFDVEPTSSFSAEELEANSHLDIFDALAMLSGVTVFEQEVSIRGGGTPLLYIDNVPTDIEFLESVNMSDVAALGVLDGPDAVIYGSGADNGVILIALKEGADLTRNMLPIPSLVYVRQLGYKKPERFYQPKYEIMSKLTDRTPDLRTTICWDPFIQTNEDGKTSFSFYAADKDATYDVTLEGITKTGQIIYKTITITKSK